MCHGQHTGRDLDFLMDELLEYIQLLASRFCYTIISLLSDKRYACSNLSLSAAGKSLLDGEMLILGCRLKTCGRGYLALEHSPKIEKY